MLTIQKFKNIDKWSHLRSNAFIINGVSLIIIIIILFGHTADKKKDNRRNLNSRPKILITIIIISILIYEMYTITMTVLI